MPRLVVLVLCCVACASTPTDPMQAYLGHRLDLYADRLDGGDLTLAEDYFAELTPGFPMVWDRHGTFTSSYPIANLPTLFLLDREGVVRHVQVGFDETTAAAIELRVRDLL